jgi:hypothetical protein
MPLGAELICGGRGGRTWTPWWKEHVGLQFIPINQRGVPNEKQTTNYLWFLQTSSNMPPQ